ncbi:hypothetical protein GCM10011515_18140 [Tsuneonella deserti]|uniref:Thioesterase domain-containing protein n=1 Tax=Tsuneonella deserti TaxID=2035528 RepID=A0ABQ1S8C4_9SPHN|nr:PaaI family thioesterase [Tsuneonella deserti]GGD98660.1 hypothetical protein GCM10011515_18140 [Tsuneonella deserti]
MSAGLTPYAEALGMRIVEGGEDGATLLALDFGHELEGRPGAWHGGAIAGLLETAGYAALRSELVRQGRDPLLKPINITVQYLSTGRPRESFARGRIVRLGRRNANLEVEAWQDDPAKPIASAVMNILMVEEEASKVL